MAQLTDAQVQAYHDRGYLVLPGFKSAEDCARLRRRAAALIDGFDSEAERTVFSTRAEEDAVRNAYFMESGDKIRFFLEEEALDEAGRLTTDKHLAINKIGHALHDLDPDFEAFSHDARLAEICSRLGHADPRLLQSMYICKQPRIGGAVRPHQDSSYLYTEPESTIGFWFALEDAHLANGCLWVLPGAHKGPLECRYARDAAGGARIQPLWTPDWDDAAWTPVEVRTGDLIVFHGYLPHKSEANRTDASRHAYTLHVIDGACTYPPENWLRRDPANPPRPFAVA